MNDTNRFLRLAEVQEITGLGKTTIRREREPWCSPSPTRQTFPSRQTRDADAAHASVCEWLADARVVRNLLYVNGLHVRYLTR